VLASPATVRGGLLPCLREDPQLWFSEQPADLDLAKPLCQPCPLRGHCLDGALARREPHGVWGGKIFEQGMITQQRRRAAATR
jgi:WhiB family redox-sensing transcriptional regulator